MCLPFHLSQWCIRAEFFSASISLQITIACCWGPVVLERSWPPLGSVSKTQVWQGIDRFMSRSCVVGNGVEVHTSLLLDRCSAIVPLQLHSYPLDDGRSTAEAAAAAERCGSASGITHRPNINGRAEDYAEYPCWCACGPENIAVGERSQAFIQLKPCQLPHHLPDIVSAECRFRSHAPAQLHFAAALAWPLTQDCSFKFACWAVATRDHDVKQRRATPLSDRTKP